MSETTSPVAVLVPPAVPTPETGFLNLGHYPHPDPARTLEVNSRYLSLDGKPWMPVMGEFHYSRFPEDEWAVELAKMRAGGVDVVASYVIWNHHEPFEGQWHWEGRRDLARFIDLAAQAGLLVYLRPGPWVHAEVRLGGFPDWLPATGPLRCNDATYLGHVRRFYDQIAAQAKGRLWCDGGPVIGLQLENEYGATGPGCGAEHIAELKRLAIESGMTVPIYTVTGWPTLDIPPREVLPVSGAYADGFWQGSRDALPPSGVFLFNTRRVIGEMGNVDGTPAAGLIDTAHYPFCLAEAGGGMHQSYHRRPVISTEDVYATTLVQLGSGANLYGYYMYHGGTNPVCETGPLNETQATGYPNDVPQWGYDFHAPLGQYGQVRPSWGRLRCLHQFMQAFGDTLAPLEATLPAHGPFDPADREQVRVSVRAAGETAAALEGFVFVNHHVRHHPLPAREGFQVSVQTADGVSIQLPMAGSVDLVPGMAFIWPVGQRIGTARLRQATVQPLTRWTDASGAVTWVGFRIDGVVPELVLDAAGLRLVEVSGGDVDRLADDSGWLVRLAGGDLPQLITLHDAAGLTHRMLILSEAAAAQSAHAKVRGEDRIVWSSHPATWDPDSVTLHRAAHDPAWLRIFPATRLGGDRERLCVDWAVWTWAGDQAARWSLQPELLQQAGDPPALRWGPQISWRDGPTPLVPDEAAQAAAARWTLALPERELAVPGEQASRIWLRLDLSGDMARLWADGVVVDDRFCDGSVWHIGLDRFRRENGWARLVLSVLPAPDDLPVFLEAGARAAGGQARVRAAMLDIERRETIRVGDR